MFLRLIGFAVIFFSASVAIAQTPPKGDVSDKTLRTLKALAWQSLPSKIVLGANKVVEIDKSDSSKVIIPDEDARDVIRAAHLTARAHRCGQQELVIANRDALLLREKKRGKWSDSQLQYINALHLYTVQLLVGKIEVVDPDKAKANFDAKAAPMPESNLVTCNENELKEIQSAVEANEKLVGKS